MVNETIFRKQLLNKDQLAEVIYNERVIEKKKVKRFLKKNHHFKLAVILIQKLNKLKIV